MDIDIILEPDLTPEQITELGQAAEGFGIRALWTSNYFAHWDPFISLVPLAQQTDRILMGPLAVSPFEMHPLKIANGLLTLNEMCDGRAQVAIGAGEGNIDAMALETPKKIVLAIREALEIVLAAAHGELASGYDGEIFNVNLPCAYDWIKAAPPRIYMTAYRFMMMRMGGRVADGVFVGCTPPEIMEPAMENVRTGVGRRDTPPEDFRVNTFWAWHIKEDREAAFRESRRELAWRGRKLDPELLVNWLTEEEAQFVQDNLRRTSTRISTDRVSSRAFRRHQRPAHARHDVDRRPGGSRSGNRTLQAISEEWAHGDRAALARRSDGCPEDYRRKSGSGSALAPDHQTRTTWCVQHSN